MITFEKIRDLERGERESKELQKLPDIFLDQLLEYLRKKRLIKEKTSSDMTELSSVRNVIRNFFEIRERKLLDQLVYSLRTGARPRNMTPDESETFDSIYMPMKKHRTELLSSLDSEAPADLPPKESAPARSYDVLSDMPDFVGSDLSVYSLKSGSVVALPDDVASLLLKHGLIAEKKA